jgi:uncharacterized protein YgbK (DUF1537 family)
MYQVKMKFGIIADDLTGALDTGLEFWKKGLKTVVVTSSLSIAEHARRFDAIAVCTSSRLSSPREARDKVAKAAARLKKHGAKFFYKKVDSTLRGNIGTEIEAVMDELQIRTTIIVPALPEQGRAVMNGNLLVDGKPLDKTNFKRDPINPISEPNIPALIEGQTRKKVGLITLPTVRGNLVREIEALKRRGVNIIVLDAVTRKDLGRIAESIAKTGLSRLSCGSSGLAAELPLAFGLCDRPQPTVVLSGSLNPVTKAQIMKMEKTLDPFVVKFDPKFFVKRFNHCLKDLDKVLEAVKGGQDTVLCLWNGEGFYKSEKDRALSSFRRVVRKITSKERFGNLVVVGGETASQACRAMGTNAIEIEDEVDLGIACARILNGKLKGIRIVTKAGGFGEENALVKAVDFLKMRRR